MSPYFFQHTPKENPRCPQYFSECKSKTAWQLWWSRIIHWFKRQTKTVVILNTSQEPHVSIGTRVKLKIPHRHKNVIYTQGIIEKHLKYDWAGLPVYQIQLINGENACIIERGQNYLVEDENVSNYTRNVLNVLLQSMLFGMPNNFKERQNIFRQIQDYVSTYGIQINGSLPIFDANEDVPVGATLTMEHNKREVSIMVGLNQVMVITR